MDAALFPAFQLLPYVKDGVCATETQQRAIVDGSRQRERHGHSQQAVQQEKFEAKFKALADAIASFAKRYNEGRGKVRPHRKAERLRNAIHELQSLEQALKAIVRCWSN